MNLMYLVRVSRTVYATYGVLVKPDGEAFAVALELPWRKNKRSISSIPAGTYQCQRFKSVKHPDTFQIMGVPGRDGVLLHVGNQPKDSNGCILVGEQFELKGIALSKKGFAEFMSIAGAMGSFGLVITDPPASLLHDNNV